MGFFDKIKKAFMNEKETKPAEIETDETLEEAEAGSEVSVPEETDVDSLSEQSEPELEAEIDVDSVVEPELEIELEPKPMTDDVLPEEAPETEAAEEIQEEIIVQEKYEKGLEKTRKTFGERLNELFANFRSVDEDFFEELEETLIGADVGFDTAIKITDQLRQEVKLRNAKKPAAIQNTIIEKMVDLYEAEGVEENNALNIQTDGLTVMLFVGVNGVGKTTSIGKLAHEFKQDGKKVLMAAADTFRAGAIDQLVVWGERAGVEVVRGNAGGDPAAVVFDAVERAKAENADILLVDTAGRLQNKVNLMNELEKIKRVIQREIPDAPHEVLLVVDATTGQNAMSQAKQFKETTDVTGLVLTKLDGTAKGGIVLAIRNELHLPVKLVGLGEGINDLEPFDANDFAVGLFKGLLKEED
ncbi:MULTISPECIES: signal recognition particle-docking protein FtsY [unclassified Enterococcus]|uniref:signal recognition particle-docking protein FtsY n=1 Tax=unclassified Enterococcus TaxID=2608891 RepID=UPI001CE20768|nr:MULTISPECIES: signal recognition particle-docking protein FtsY [unclassified Enterococcus]MCA5013589.1 signal recognition particle-docking protein FtsY [Enterococcus sp. S23]MCA5016839.1 signal recognition particle-docking protein FtsY [Enterococcus sp. S22(2020)]